MTPNTIFDLASLTKVVATTTAVMQLVDRGKLGLDDPVAIHWPEFKKSGKEQMTIRQLLTHFSGLRSDIPSEPEWEGYASALQKVLEENPISSPGTRFLYSDLNFIILGELVQRVSGQTLDQYCHQYIFKPLGMKDTRFQPAHTSFDRIAPTRENQIGEVHDPLARRMGGVAGHAGVFSTADDLSLFAQALLNGGRGLKGRILSPSMVEMMAAPQSPPGFLPVRGLGWGIDSPFTSNRFELLPVGSYHHRGFTGTGIWIDPITETHLIILTNRVYPNGHGQVEPLRARILALLSQAIGPMTAEEVLSRRPSLAPYDQQMREFPGPVQTGIDVLAARRFAPLAGLRVGLVTNHTGLDSNGRRTIDLFFKAKGVKLSAIFSPEHGPSGQAEEKVISSREPSTGLPIYSLYGEALRPTPTMLKDLDALVFDLQDAGVRFYTYITTMGYAMEAAAQKGLHFYVLDRPNPLTGSRVEGPILDQDQKSFAGYFPLPLRHWMTVGELAKMFNRENKIGAKLQVIAMLGYQRSHWYDQTGLAWVNPSPNLCSLTQATLYPGVALVEGANVSVGRGTDTPFELIGAPWIRSTELAAYLNRRQVKGVAFDPVEFIPIKSRFKNEVCHGVRITLEERQVFHPSLLGIEIASALYRLYPKDFQIDQTLSLIGSRRVWQAVKEGKEPRSIVMGWQEPLVQFHRLRAKYLIYPP